MAKEHWHVLKVRPGFARIVIQKLRKLELEVFVPKHKSIGRRDSRSLKHSASSYVYCRFAPENRTVVITIPGVLDIVDTSEDLPADADRRKFT